MKKQMNKLCDRRRKYLAKNIGRARVRVLGAGVQLRTQPKAVLGWAWKGIGLGSESDSVYSLSRVGLEECRVRIG